MELSSEFLHSSKLLMFQYLVIAILVFVQNVLKVFIVKEKSNEKKEKYAQPHIESSQENQIQQGSQVSQQENDIQAEFDKTHNEDKLSISDQYESLFIQTNFYKISKFRQKFRQSFKILDKIFENIARLQKRSRDLYQYQKNFFDSEINKIFQQIYMKSQDIEKL